MKYLKYISTIFIFAALLLNSCSKNNPYENFPDVYFPPFPIDPNSTLYQNLNIVGGYEYIHIGFPSNGIIVYRKSNDEFNAYERTCTHDPLERCVLEVTEGSLITDSCCDSRFYIGDGNPFDGPAIYPLRKYRTTYSGGILTISN